MALDNSIPKTETQERRMPLFLTRIVSVRPDQSEDSDELNGSILETVAYEERQPDMDYARKRGIELGSLPRVLLKREYISGKGIPLIDPGRRMEMNAEGAIVNPVGVLPYEFRKVGFLHQGLKVNASGKIETTMMAYKYGLYDPDQLLDDEARHKLEGWIALLEKDFPDCNVSELNDFLTRTTGLNLFDMVKTQYFIYNSDQISEVSEAASSTPEAFISAKLGIPEQLVTAIVANTVRELEKPMTWELIGDLQETEVIPPYKESDLLTFEEISKLPPKQQPIAKKKLLKAFLWHQTRLFDRTESYEELIMKIPSFKQLGSMFGLSHSTVEAVLKETLSDEERLKRNGLIMQQTPIGKKDVVPPQLFTSQDKIPSLSEIESLPQAEQIKIRERMLYTFLWHQMRYLKRVGSATEMIARVPSYEKLGEMFGLHTHTVNNFIARHFAQEEIDLRNRFIKEQNPLFQEKVSDEMRQALAQIVVRQLDQIDTGEIDMDQMLSGPELASKLAEEFPETPLTSQTINLLLRDVLTLEDWETRQSLLLEEKTERIKQYKPTAIDPDTKRRLVDLARYQLQAIEKGEIELNAFLNTSDLSELYGIKRSTVGSILRDGLSEEEFEKRREYIEKLRNSRGVNYKGERFGSADEAVISDILFDRAGYTLDRLANYQVVYKRDGRWMSVDYILTHNGRKFALDYHAPHLELMEDIVDGLNPYQRAKLYYPDDPKARKEYIDNRAQYLMRLYKERRAPFIPEGIDYVVMGTPAEFFNFLSGLDLNQPLPEQSEFLADYRRRITSVRKEDSLSRHQYI